MDQTDVLPFLRSTHPLDVLAPDDFAPLAAQFILSDFAAGEEIFHAGDPLSSVFLIASGTVEVSDENGALVSILRQRNFFGERGLLRDGKAATSTRAGTAVSILALPERAFRDALVRFPAFSRYFTPAQPIRITQGGLVTLHVTDMLAKSPVTCRPDTPITEAARLMRDARVSSLGVTTDGILQGIVTVRDMTNKVLAEGRDPALPVSTVMTVRPVTLDPSALGSDVMNKMIEHRIGHLPVVEAGRFLGMITQTDLTRFMANSQAQLVADLMSAESLAQMAEVTRRLPQFLMSLVGSHLAHDVVTRKVTDIADIVTRRLLAMAEKELGAAPVPYVWAACGSQGRREQTGVSDQDNCLILSDSASPADMAYFERMARYVCDGLNACGYVYCPGDMMATAERWRQPLAVWRDYFARWISQPDEEAQMLASVMFDLRPIGGDESLFDALQADTLDMAARNSIFVAHMVGNALKHTPPLSLLRGFATIKSGEHRNSLDMKMNGVVPVVDLGRIYALRGQLRAVNTRARIDAAIDAGIISDSGGRDLLAAYDTIATARLEHQALLVRNGEKPDNYLAPSSLAAFERNHLRDAFSIVKTMQNALTVNSAR